MTASSGSSASSPPAVDAPDRADRKRKREREPQRLGALPRPLALVFLMVWATLTVVAAVTLGSAPVIWSGEREGLIPTEHRATRGRPLALIRVDPEALEASESETPDTELGPDTILAEAGFSIEEALAGERVPLAPPKTEITRWLDAHALYLLPISAHEGLAERLTDARMLAEVQGLEARLSSPLFSVSGDQPRRDPLGIHDLTEDELGRLGHVAEIPGSDDPQVSPSGDLLAASGDRALIALRSDRSPAELLTDLRAAVEHLPVTVTLIDPSVDEAALAAELRAGGADRAGGAEASGAEASGAALGDGWTVTIAGFAILILLLSIVLRRLVPVLALGACLGSVWLMLMAALTSVSGGVDLASVALAVVALGFGCDAALRLQRIGVRGWASTLVTAVALLPLLLTPYPLWQRWAVVWLGTLLLTAIVMRWVLPTLLALAHGDFDWRRPGFRLLPMPALAVGICVALTAAGAWSSQQLRYRPGTRLPTATAQTAAVERELIEHFFDPSMIVEAESSPAEDDLARESSPAAAALDVAATDVALLAELVPSEARRVDSPGSFVLPRPELESRKQALAKLDLRLRMEALDLLLVDQGLRSEAFAEFVRGAADIDDLPSAQAALDGPLGPWIAGYLPSDPEQPVQLSSRVELRGRDGLPSVPLTRERLAALPRLHGPAIAAMLDQREFDDRVGVVVLVGLWLGAFLVWLGTGSLATAVAVAFVAVASQCGVLLGLSLLGQPIGPHLLPIFALVGATAVVAGGRACRAVNLGQPIVARGQLLSGACQVVIGIVLLTSAQPLWRELGLTLAIGSALASGLGLFATPGLALLFDKLRRARGPKSSPPDKAKGGGHD